MVDEAEQPVESLFGQAMVEYIGTGDVFRLIGKMRSITALKALQLRDWLEEDGREGAGLDKAVDIDKLEEFGNWDLETRLWDLGELLMSFRHSPQQELIPECKLSSLAVKQENFIAKNPRIRELAIIISWLQKNMPSIVISDNYNDKWNNTKLALNKDSNGVANDKNKQPDLITDFDIDAPLRLGKKIDKTDDVVDSQNFEIIYKLLLANKTQEAIDYANDTGNYPLALILIGSTQDYTDPQIDFSELVSSKKASGIKHKLLWKNTVYKLSQQSNLNHYELLIYNFLCGGDISSNLAEASQDYEQYLLLYLSQLLSYQLDSFTHSILNTSSNIPTPQLTSVEQILDTISKANPSLSAAAQHPIRVINGAIMINQESKILKNFIQNQQLNQAKPYLIRILTHLSILKLIIDGPESIDTQDLTTLLTIYISNLFDYNFKELIPIYVNFIPNEEDAREIYSLFLSEILDEDERLKQIEISKSITNQLILQNDEIQLDGEEDRMTNVLRRTVERVVKDTSDHYNQAHQETITCDQVADKIDIKLYRSIEWFYAYSMHEDAILASIVIIRRFLLNGKLDALKQFAKGKNFKKLIKDYDTYNQTQELSDDKYVSKISEVTKQEFIEYSKLTDGLSLIDEWKNFEKLNGGSSLIDTSIEKSNNLLKKLILTWFKDLINQNKGTEDGKIFEEFRNIYIPYLILELLEIYQKAKDSDWKYIKLAFKLITEVADDKKNDYLPCFIQCGRLKEFLVKSGEISAVAVEKGISGIFV